MRVENGEVSLSLLVLMTSPPRLTLVIPRAQILAETYQPMPSYRLCTADGVLQLTDGLATRLVEVLKSRVLEEQK